jgi:Cholesterol oxidase, substrate-binding/FAD binding domain
VATLRIPPSVLNSMIKRMEIRETPLQNLLKPVAHKWKHESREFHEISENLRLQISPPRCLFKYLRMAFGLHKQIRILYFRQLWRRKSSGKKPNRRNSVTEETKNVAVGAADLSRRNFLTGAASVAALGFVPGERLYAESGATTIPTPPNFPSGISLYQQTYTNWAQEISVANVWTCSPNTSADVATLANWAHATGFRLRPLGSGHGFAPTILSRGSTGANYFLVNTTDHLTRITVNAHASVASVTAQAGAQLQNIAAACEPYGLGFLHTPAPGDVTIGGGLAMNVHGTSLPALNQELQPGHTYGTFSNLVLSLTAVVWDWEKGSYVLKTFHRNDPGIGPLLTHLARAFVTDVKLQMGPNLKLRCVSHTDIAMPTLFAPPSSAGADSYASLIDQYGPTEVIWFPFVQDSAWIKTWQAVPVQPSSSREVTAPYNYPFSDNTPLLQADETSAFLRTTPSSVPGFNALAASATKSELSPSTGDAQTQMYDLWGSAYCLTFYVKDTSLRVTTAAWGLVMHRSNIQRAVSEFYNYLTATLSNLASQNEFPYVGPVEIRAQGLDRASEVLVPDAVEPYLSGARPVPDHPEYDVILWFAVNNNVDQGGAASFNHNLEQWFLLNYSSYAVVRPEWTKTYAFTTTGAYGGGWTNKALLTEIYPETFRYGYPFYANWDSAVATLNFNDPNRVFTNPFLDTLMPSYGSGFDNAESGSTTYRK